ncbi:MULTISPECIES: CHAP domain-containing protein [unclassified Gilliamella]|uniref:CHAP domain-containing protein n=1 Tax=unclassified Gilliamella TaxID=2685620 RepID=UPI001321C6FC|nr:MULTISPECIES: CHAP domain-containing protein [unclassified Gilliamella]MWN32538.1 CHAP domain-containing protein [Gilliamella sp. Pra-s60]MWP29986.1 CHAP domain-containing protein [Gilliamella sp. Pra-s54]
MLLKYKKVFFGIWLLSVLSYYTLNSCTFANIEINEQKIGNVIDEFNGVKVYYNGSIYNVSGRNIAKDGYNLGLKYQCVEFIKRYYYQRFNHKMPNSYGHAKDFFDPLVADGKINRQRNLLQFHNGSPTKPKVEDIIVLNWTSYGHVAIVSNVTDNEIEIVQQNSGPNANSRATFPLIFKDGKWTIEGFGVLGYLRKM